MLVVRCDVNIFKLTTSAQSIYRDVYAMILLPVGTAALEFTLKLWDTHKSVSQVPRPFPGHNIISSLKKKKKHTQWLSAMIRVQV